MLKFRYIIIVLLSILFSACGGDLSAIKTQETPTPILQINSVRISSITLDTIFLNTNIDIINPYSIDVPIKGATINIYYQDKIINSYKIEGENTLKALSKSNLLLESNIKILDLVKLIPDYREAESIDVKVEVATSLPLPKILNLGDSFQLKERFETNIPTISLFISLKDVTYNAPNLTFILHLKNRAKAPLLLDDVAYSFQLNEVNFNNIADVVYNGDNSIDLRINIDTNNANLINLDDIKKTNISIQSALQISEIPYKIPINIDFRQ